MFHNRKGTVLDTTSILLLLFVFVVALFLVGAVWTEFVSITSSMPIMASNTNATGAIALTSNALLMYDIVVLVYLMSLGMVAVIFAYYVESHPIMFAVSMITLMISVILASLFVNVFLEMAAIDSLSAVSASYPLTVTLMQNLPGFIAVIGVLIIIAMAKRRKE